MFEFARELSKAMTSLSRNDFRGFGCSNEQGGVTRQIGTFIRLQFPKEEVEVWYPAFLKAASRHSKLGNLRNSTQNCNENTPKIGCNRIIPDLLSCNFQF
jgi:hypothetical protein